MAIATKTKPKAAHHKKRVAAHHRQNKQYVKSYWPYIPLITIVSVGLLVNGLLSHPSAILGTKSDLSVQALVNATNVTRTQNGKAGLQLNPQLNTAAQAKANDMVAHNYWSHTAPTGNQPSAFVAGAGYQYQILGENLAYGFDSAKTTLNAWMHSDEHRANLLDSAYNEIGFGVATSPDFVGSGPETVVVAMYAQPVGTLTPAAPKTITPESSLVTRAQTVAFTPSTNSLLIGLIGAVAVVFVFVRHGIAWRKLLSRGEVFVIDHPVLDIALISVAMLAVILNHAVGFIH